MARLEQAQRGEKLEESFHGSWRVRGREKMVGRIRLGPPTYRQRRDGEKRERKRF
jgi:hypothetical protein